MGKTDRGEIRISFHACKGCALCIAACPSKVLSQGKDLNRQGYYAAVYNGSGCTGCGLCFYVCPEPDAITILIHKEDVSGKSAA